ncbi:hypothetical protein ACFCV3_41775 [Kribbella sp. NPDC056345]|uniref:hypothetical protein n=1 Tax=Kribbella sp. NPDC056345 TaxID=3345789 RepID=UPI0035DBE8D1
MNNPTLTVVPDKDLDCDLDAALDLDVDEYDEDDVDPETERIINEILAQRNAATDLQERADLILAALGYLLADAHSIALTVTDDVEDGAADCFMVEALLDADGTILERHPEDWCLASNLEIIDTTGDVETEPVWWLPDAFQPHFIPSAELVAAGVAIGNVMTFRAATSDLRALWSTGQ